MGMSDQYNDGRYDALPDEDDFADTSIGYVPVTAPRGGIKYPPPPERNCVISPGGWHTPVSQLTGWPFRGTLHYHPTKEENMQKSTPQEQLQKAIEAQSKIGQVIDSLKAQIAAEIPPTPRASLGEAFSVTVKFQRPGKSYRFLILRTERGWFTTGTANTGHFRTWKELVEWLHGGDLAWHSRMMPLDVTHADDALAEWHRD
jgi:hypothetical protein